MRLRLKNEACLFRRSSWGSKNQLRLWVSPQRPGQGRDEERKAREGSELGQDYLHVLQMRFSPGRIRGHIQGDGVIVKDQN